MEIILLENILNLGNIGDKVTVKNGYGRNFLLKQGKALRFNNENQELVNKRKDELNKKNTEIKIKFKEIAKLVNNKTFIFNKESKENGELYGSIKPKEITNLINEKTSADVSPSQIILKDDLNKIVRYWKSSDFKLGSFAKGWHPPHPAFFVKKDIYEKYGMFDLQLKVSADFDLMLRFLEKYQISSMYLPKILVKMRIGGESNSSLKNIITSNQSILKSFKKNGIRVNRLMYLFYRLVPKIIQIIKRGR